MWCRRLLLRETQHISRRQASNTRPAILLAEKLGTPLNRHVTINFTLLGVQEDQCSSVLGRLRARYCRWAKRPGKKRRAEAFAPAMMWVMENTAHAACHLLMHVPAARLANFRADLTKWIEKDTGTPMVPGVLHIGEVYNPHGLRKYMLKGMDPMFADLYRINHVPQGPVLGKRFGFTQNLGPSQCRKHGTKRPYRWPRRGAGLVNGAAIGANG